MFVNCLALGKVNALSLSFNICKTGIVLPVLKDHANNEMMADIMHGSEQVCSECDPSLPVKAALDPVLTQCVYVCVGGIVG